MEMRGLGLVAVLLCVAVVLGTVSSHNEQLVAYMLHKTVLHVGQGQDRDKASKKSKGKLLSPPVPRKCSESEWASESGFSSHFLFLGPKRFRFQGHNYFYSGDVAPYKKIKYDWLDGRNFCRWLLVVNCGCVTAISPTNQGILHGSGFLGDSARERLHSKLAWVTQFNLHLDVWEVCKLILSITTITNELQALWLWRLRPARFEAHQHQRVVLDRLK